MRLVFAVLLLSCACVSAQTLPAANDTFDTVIIKGHIIDGTGSPWYSGQIGIRAGHIAAIGDLTAVPRQRTIDAHGKVVVPGFIDMRHGRARRRARPETALDVDRQRLAWLRT